MEFGTSSQKFCDLELDRDYNAALNIHKRGVGHSLPPVKRGPLLCIPASAVVAEQVLVMKQEPPEVTAG